MSSSFQSRLREWKIDRRRFLYTTGGLAGLVATSRLQALTQTVTPSFSSNPFTLGVASGDPLPDSVVLWTRLAPEPLAVDARCTGPWRPTRMRHVVQRGVAFADPFAHRARECRWLSPGGLLVSVQRPGRMEPGRSHADEDSLVGVTTTVPLRVCLVPAFRDGLLHRLPAHGRRGSGSRAVPRRLHL